MKKKLTPKSIEALRPAEGKRYEVRDELVPGLCLRVSASGRKVWSVTARVGGRQKRVGLGSYPPVSLADARQKARDARQKARDALCDIETAVEPKPVPTLGEIVPQFIELYAKPRNRDWKGTERILQKFEPIYRKSIAEVRRADVVRILDEIVAGGAPYRANRALAAIKKLFAWCVDRGTVEFNPVAGLKPPAKEVVRDRVLTDEELIAAWNLDDGYPFTPFVRMLILTGQRRGEVSGMRWSEIDFDKAVWTIPAERSKNKTAHTVPLAPVAVDILQNMPRFLDSDFVHTTTGKTPISG